MSGPAARPEAGSHDGARSAGAAAVAHRAEARVSPRPPGFVEHVYEQTFDVPVARGDVWAWLDEPAHFSGAQVFPVRIEFAPGAPGDPTGFGLGALNLHHGPMMGLAGVMTDVRPGVHREMQYLYGSYVLSLRLIRPRAMRLELEEAEAGRTRVRVRFTSWLHPRMAGPWMLFQRLLWWRFPAQVRKGAARPDA